MRLNVHMPETRRHPRCTAGCGPTTRIVEWRVADPHSATGDETYGPFYQLVCGADRCLRTALAMAEIKGGDLIEYYDIGAHESTTITWKVAL